MTDTKIQEKLKPGLKLEDLQKDGDIYLALNPDYVSGDNAKYMTMYNRLARCANSSGSTRAPEQTARTGGRGPC